MFFRQGAVPAPLPVRVEQPALEQELAAEQAVLEQGQAVGRLALEQELAAEQAVPEQGQAVGQLALAQELATEQQALA